MNEVDDLRFGHASSFRSEVAQDLSNLPINTQVKIAAFHHACPIPDEVVRDYNLEETLNRYLSCDAWMRWASLVPAREINPALYEQLTTAVPRLPDEPVGHFEEGTVPESHQRQMSPASTLWGYALPRVAIEKKGRGENVSAARTFQTLEIARKAVAASSTPIELLARMAEAAVTKDEDDITVQDSDVNIDAVISHILAPGKLREENCRTMFLDVAEALETYAPTVWSRYKSIPKDELAKLDIADVDLL